MPIHDPTPARIADEGDGDAGAANAGFRRLSPAEIRAWVREARPRARIVYSRGAFVDQHVDKAVVELVRALHDAGYIRLHLSRPGKGEPIDYLAIRRDKPVLAGAVL
jgi:hypothetical protein